MEEKILGPNGQLCAWMPRPRLAAITSLVAHGGPTVLAIAVGIACSRLFPQPVGAGAFAWWVGIIAVGVLVLAALQPVARRALALSGLLQLAIEFPTPPPSRVAAAWRGSDPGTVRRRLEQVHMQERSPSLQTDLAVLAATLGVLEHRRRQAEVVFRVGDDDITTRVVESDIPGFFQVVPIGSSSRKVLVIVVASTAAAALAASAALGPGSSGTGTLPSASPAGPPTASVDTTPPPSAIAPPFFDGTGTINPSTPSPRAGAPGDDAAANPPPGSATVTPAPTPAAGGSGSTQAPATAPAGDAGRTGDVTTSGAQASSAGAQPVAPVAPAPAPSPVAPSPTAASPATAPVASTAQVFAAAAGIDDTATIDDAGAIATFAARASAIVDPEDMASDDTATAPEQSEPAPEVQDEDAWHAGDDTEAPPPVDDPVVDAPTTEAPPVPETAVGTNDANLDASSDASDAPPVPEVAGVTNDANLAASSNATDAAENPPPPGTGTADQPEREDAPISP